MDRETWRLDGNIHRGRELHFQVDGEPMVAYEGETLAAALTAVGRRIFRHTAEGKPRGIFCGTGVCFDCMVTIDGGRRVQACITPVQQGMHITTSVSQPDKIL